MSLKRCAAEAVAWLLQVSILLVVVAEAHAQSTAASDREVLEALYHSTGGPGWSVRTNWLSNAPLGEWLGVSTDGNGRVTGLAFYGNNLSGWIPPELGGLTQLQRLDLGRNQLSGTIPPELGGLTRLEWLLLRSNQLSGAIPPELGGLTQLKWLDLKSNGLSGVIPPELGGLTQLERLELAGNPLSGKIPQSLMQLSRLSRLYIRDTDVCVPTGDDFQAWLATISDFRSSGINCDGSLRVSFSASSYVVREGGSVEVTVRLLDQTNGPAPSVAIPLTVTPGSGATGHDYAGVPERITITAPASTETFLVTAVEDHHYDHAETITLGFRRPLPPGVTVGSPDTSTVMIIDPGAVLMTDREVLEALYHSTGGPGWINRANWLSPAALGEWLGVRTDENGRVTSLDLGGNGLSGQIPPALGRLAYLERLHLDGDRWDAMSQQWVTNELSGEIPPELGELANLQSLNLDRNQLSREIPPELGDLTNLQRLDLGGNQLSGTIPPELGGLTNLQRLDLGGNQLSGAIPPELGGLTNLQSLNLDRNQLSGAIPPELASLSNLQSLNLDRNQLSGAIPPELASLSNLQSLNLGGNELSGAIPPELGGLTQLEELDIGFNQDLRGTIPSALQRLPISTLNLMATSVCVPQDAAFQEWLTTFEFLPSGCGRPAAAMSEIDIAVVYTPKARRNSGGSAEIEAQIDLMVAETNRAYVDSGVNQRLVLVAREEVEYAESRSGRTMDLDRLADASDGYMDEVHEMRDQVGADLVHLIAYLIDPGGSAQLPGAFGVTCATCDALVFAHELGHNMGLSHDRYVAGTALFPHSYGYLNQRAFADGAPESSRWHTIMAYEDQCKGARLRCGAILRFSNPNQTYLGDPLGVPGDERTAAVAGPADATRTLNLTRHSVAAFRPRSQDTISQSSPGGKWTERPPAAAGVRSGGLFTAISPLKHGGGASDPKTLRRRDVDVDIGMLAQVPAAEPTALPLNLFDDVMLTGIIVKRTPTYSGGYALSGPLFGVAGGSVTLVVNGDVVAGTVRIPGATYRIRPAGAGRHAIAEIDPAQSSWRCGTEPGPPIEKNR